MSEMIVAGPLSALRSSFKRDEENSNGFLVKRVMIFLPRFLQFSIISFQIGRMLL